jgi:hypothetical protein
VPSDPPWWGYHPPRHRDIRRLVSGAPTLDALQNERDERIRILRGSDNIEHWRLADALANAEPREPVNLGACPLNARLLQIYASSQTLEQLEPFEELFMATVADAHEAIGVEGLPALEWRRLHNCLRRRIERSVCSATVGLRSLANLNSTTPRKHSTRTTICSWGTLAVTNWRGCARITPSWRAPGLRCASILFQTGPGKFPTR